MSAPHLPENTDFNCKKKKDKVDKPYKYGDRTNKWEDPTIFSGFIDVLENQGIEVTLSDIRVYAGNVLVRPGITTVQELQVEKELFVCKQADFQDNVIIKKELCVVEDGYIHKNLYVDGANGIGGNGYFSKIVYCAAVSTGYNGGTGNATITGDVGIDKDITTVENITMNQDLSIGGNISNVQNITLSGTATGDFSGTFNGTINVQSWKSFDIRHPNKDGWRLRHVCTEGPEAAIYVRGKLNGDNMIPLPDYWKGLVDYDSITVHLTPEGRADSSLYVSDINEDRIIIASSENLKNIRAHYIVYVARLGTLVVEYEGDTVADYPGDNTNFTYQP